MAQPTKVIRRTEVDVDKIRADELRALEDQLIMHKDTLHKLFRLLDQLDEHEVFNALNAGLAKSDPILTRALGALNDTELDKAIRNILLLSQGLGKLKLDDLEPLILKVNKGLQLSSDNSQAGLKTLLSREFITGTAVLLNFVKGFGSDVEQLKQEQGIVTPIQTDTGRLDQVSKVQLPGQRKKSSKSNTNKLIGITAAAVLSAGALILKK